MVCIARQTPQPTQHDMCRSVEAEVQQRFPIKDTLLQRKFWNRTFLLQRSAQAVHPPRVLPTSSNFSARAPQTATQRDEHTSHGAPRSDRCVHTACSRILRVCWEFTELGSDKSVVDRRTQWNTARSGAMRIILRAAVRTCSHAHHQTSKCLCAGM